MSDAAAPPRAGADILSDDLLARSDDALRVVYGRDEDRDVAS